MSTGNASTTSTQTQSLPPWADAAAQNFLGTAQGVANLPYVPYTGQRVADLSPLQRQSIQNIAGLSGGTPSMAASEDMLTRTLQGGYSNPYAHGNAVSPGGMYSFSPVTSGANPYIGESPYFEQTRQSALGDIVHNYQTAISPEITREVNLSGNLGGSADLTARANAQRQLLQQLGRTSADMGDAQYGRSAQLAESGLGRALNAGQFNASLGNSAFESAAQRGLNAGEFNANLGNQGYENERARQMQAAGASGSLYNTLLNGQSTALQAGGIERSQQQDLLSSLYNDFLEQRGYPSQQLGIYGNALGSILGRAPMNTTTTQGLPPPDRVSQGLGLLALAGMFK